MNRGDYTQEQDGALETPFQALLDETGHYFQVGSFMHGLICDSGRCLPVGTLTVLERVIWLSVRRSESGESPGNRFWEDALFVRGAFHLGNCVREWVLGRIPARSDIRFRMPGSCMEDNVLYDYATDGLDSWGTRWLGVKDESSILLLNSRVRPASDGGLIELMESESRGAEYFCTRILSGTMCCIPGMTRCKPGESTPVCGAPQLNSTPRSPGPTVAKVRKARTTRNRAAAPPRIPTSFVFPFTGLLQDVDETPLPQYGNWECGMKKGPGLLRSQPCKTTLRHLRLARTR